MKRFLPLAASVLLFSSPAMASVQITIFEDGKNTIAEAVGSLDLPLSSTIAHCGGIPGLIPNGAVAPARSALCLGPAQGGFVYSITGPTAFGNSLGKHADESSGSFFGINGSIGIMALSSSEVNARSIWRNTSLKDLGIQPNSVNTWLVNNQEIKMVATPGPLPVLGAIGLFGWARKLRNRIRIQ